MLLVRCVPLAWILYMIIYTSTYASSSHLDYVNHESPNKLESLSSFGMRSDYGDPTFTNAVYGEMISPVKLTGGVPKGNAGSVAPTLSPSSQPVASTVPPTYTKNVEKSEK